METAGPGSYAEFVGLWLNVPRVRHQLAFVTGVGVQIGTGAGLLSDEYGDALARTEAEAGEELFRLNAARKEARSLSR